METYGFKEFPKLDNLSLEDYKKLKADILTTNTISDLKEIKEKNAYTNTIPAVTLTDLLNKLLDKDTNDSTISFKFDAFVSNANVRYNSDTSKYIRNHIVSIFSKRLLLLLTTDENNIYNQKLNPLIDKNNITKILLFAHGDYSTMHSSNLSELIGKLKGKLITIAKAKGKELSENIIVYTYDVNDLILPDFTTKESLKAFTDKFGKFDSIIPINCFNPESFNYGDSAKSEWEKFVKEEFVDVINENIKPDGYIITVGADYHHSQRLPQSDFFKHYNDYDTTEITDEWKGDNNIFYIYLGKTRKAQKEENNAKEKEAANAEALRLQQLHNNMIKDLMQEQAHDAKPNNTQPVGSSVPVPKPNNTQPVGSSVPVPKQATPKTTSPKTTSPKTTTPKTTSPKTTSPKTTSPKTTSQQQIEFVSYIL